MTNYYKSLQRQDKVILIVLLGLSGLQQCYYKMTKGCVCVCVHTRVNVHIYMQHGTQEKKSKEMSQKLLTFCWHLRSVAIWKPYDCWQTGMSAQACETWPYWAGGLSVYHRNIDRTLTALFLCWKIKGHFIPSQWL